MIKITLKETPPYKQTPANKKERENQNYKKELLKREAERVMKNRKMIKEDVELIIRYKRHKNKSDSANIIGGICDSLNKIVYKDDSQIKEIDYKERKSSYNEEYDVIIF